MFRDRVDAGRRLGRSLVEHLGAEGRDAIVLGIPRGGVPVALEVASALGATLDVFVVRKLGAPGNPEFAIGAVAENGVLVVDESAARILRVTEAELAEIERRETVELGRRIRRYRGSRPLPPLKDRLVIVVDDGMATGTTIIAACRSIRASRPRSILVAVPVAPADGRLRLSSEADDFVAVEEHDDFGAVGRFYERFPQSTDDEVLEALGRGRVDEGG